MSTSTVEPPEQSGNFVVTALERDNLVRHARGVIGTAADELTHERDDRELKEAAKHVAVMVALLDQLGWGQRQHDGPYTLLNDLLPIEQIRVWVSERFFATDQEVILDGVRGLRDTLDKDLASFVAICGLLARLNDELGLDAVAGTGATS